ncbi:MAG: hypothetical protein V4485_02740 [Pseudomonadota bacterium]
MPQLDIALFPSQILWLLLSFAALYLYLRYRALPKIENVIKRRADKVAEDLRAAEALAHQIALLQEECLSEELKTSREVEEIHNKIVMKCSLDKKVKLEEINDRFGVEQKRHTEEIIAAKQMVDKEMQESVIPYAGFIINRLTAASPQEQDLRNCYQKLKAAL